MFYRPHRGNPLQAGCNAPRGNRPRRRFYILYETNTIRVGDTVNVDDAVETASHFRCIDLVLDHANEKITEKLIKELYLILKNGTSDSRKDWFAVGEYKA